MTKLIRPSNTALRISSGRKPQGETDQFGFERENERQQKSAGDRREQMALADEHSEDEVDDQRNRCGDFQRLPQQQCPAVDAMIRPTAASAAIENGMEIRAESVPSRAVSAKARPPTSLHHHSLSNPANSPTPKDTASFVATSSGTRYACMIGRVR